MKYISLLLSVIFYLIGVGGLFYMIFWLGGLLPFHAMEDNFGRPTLVAILKNISLIVLFGLQHSIMARKSFKQTWIKVIPRHLERSIYVAISGLICLLIAWQWSPLAGSVWSFESGSIMYYVLYGLFFTGILFLLSSTFLINHFELFGLQQAYHNLKDKMAVAQSFKEILYYKIVRHPIYFGFMLILWCTPNMTTTHFSLSLGFTIYTLIGIVYEERDLVKVFGATYLDYKKRVPGLIPFTK